MNQDCKIASKTIAIRVQNVLPSTIHSHQCAYVKDRYIGDAVRIISDVMYIHSQDQLAMKVSCSSAILRRRLTRWTGPVFSVHHFGPALCGWVKTFNNNISSNDIN